MIDIAIISDLVGLASGSASTLKTSAETYLSLKNSGKDQDADTLKKLLSDLTGELFEARSVALEIQTKLMELQNELQAAEQFEEKLAHYEIRETDEGGQFYRLKEADPGGLLATNVCATCVVTKRLLIPLQRSGAIHTCPSCKSESIDFEARGGPPPERVRAPRGRFR